MTTIILGLTAVLGIAYALFIRLGNAGTASSNELPTGSLLDDPLLPQSFHARNRWAAHRTTFFHFGLVIALAVVTMAFEYRSAQGVAFEDMAIDLVPEIEIEVMRTAAPPPEAPLPPPPPTLERIDLTIAPLTEPSFEPTPPITPPHEPDAKVVAVEFDLDVRAPAPPPPPAFEEPADRIFKVVEQAPAFTGCESDKKSQAESSSADAILMRYIYAHIKYPAIARENGVSGTAVVQFVVEPDGSISSITPIKDLGAGLAAEVVRIVEGMCPWQPGRQRGKAVRVQFSLPVKFNLE